MTNDDAPQGAGRRDAVREKAQVVTARIRRRKIAKRATITILIVAAVAAAAWAVWRTVQPELEREVVVPENVTGDGIDVRTILAAGGEELPETDAEQDPIRVEVYADYLDADAGLFERENSEQLLSWVEEGAIDLAYHPLSLLSGQSNGTQYSTRAAAAVVCAADYAPESFVAFNHAILDQQPELESEGHTDEKIISIAKDADVAQIDAVSDCIETREFAPWVADATDRALEGSLPGTDGVAMTGSFLVLVNGVPYEGVPDDPAEFAQFVLTVSSEEYYSTPTPEPSPEETAEPEQTDAPADDE
ncbi:DsbA family protein [Microbacterium sp. gxy059]|uniref:DsbA family protein n=1 Tax=Microbacterium sp. gxy059 TaxID=2957199 RepID=UPI003D989435